jgi:hypothetical protein
MGPLLCFVLLVLGHVCLRPVVALFHASMCLRPAVTLFRLLRWDRGHECMLRTKLALACFLGVGRPQPCVL